MGERSYAEDSASSIDALRACVGEYVPGKAGLRSVMQRAINKIERGQYDADAEIAALRERVARLEAGLEAGLPEHKAELSITHNEHRSSYESAAEFLDACAIDADELARPDEIERMIESDSIWCLQWYPHTPIGFNRRYAATLDALLGEGGEG